MAKLKLTDQLCDDICNDIKAMTDECDATDWKNLLDGKQKK